jgi:sarcosine oxidase, subunit beta
MSPMTADYVIVGAGIVGTSIAFHLSQAGGGRIIVLEQERIPGSGSTGLSAGGIRQQFSTEINVRICMRSVQMLEQFPEIMGQEIEFRQTGYCFLLNTPEQARLFRESFELWRRLGLEVEWLDPAEIKRRWDYLETSDLVGGTFCPTDGSVDPASITLGYYNQSRRHGVEYRFRTPVTALETRQGRITGVRTPEGLISTGRVINAAGPHLGQVAALAGVTVPVEPVRRHCFVTDVYPDRDASLIPMLVDAATGLYFRGESGGIIMGLANKDEPSSWNLDLDYGLLERMVEALLHRAPALADTGIRRGWAGLYCVSPDHQGIIGPVPGLEGFYLVGGFSGHGIMESPAVGESLAHFLVHGSYAPVDLTPLSFKRFARGELIHEKNVI